MRLTYRSSLIIGAFLLRFVLSAFFYHPDIKSQNFHTQFLSQGVVNIYDFLAENKSSLGYTDTFNYPPLFYFFQGTWQIVVTAVLGPGLTLWLNDWSDQANFHPGIFAYLLLLKLPYFILDLLTLSLLVKLVSSPDSRRRLALFWLFNPVSLYTIYMIGQFDIIPVFLTVASLFFVTRKKYFLSGLVLGLGAAFKTYPLFLLPLLFLSDRSFKAFWSISIGTLIGWGLPMLPFISSPEFTRIVFRSQFAATVKLPYFAALYGLLLGGAFLLRKTFSLSAAFFAVTLALLVFTEFHAQWLLWPIPFLCLLISSRPKLLPLAAGLILTGLVKIFLVADQYVLLGLFVPLNPYFAYIPALANSLPRITLLRFWTQLSFMAFSLLIFFQLYASRQKNLS